MKNTFGLSKRIFINQFSIIKKVYNSNVEVNNVCIVSKINIKIFQLEKNSLKDLF